MTVTCRRCGDTWPRDPALEVACPVCRVGIGKRCRRPSGHGCDIHAGRDLLAMERGLLKPCQERAPLACHADKAKPAPVEAGPLFAWAGDR